jgi:AmpD protein
VELEGTDEESFTEPQYDELARLTRDLRERYDLADVAGHSDIAPNRKTDPGPHFNWVRYRQSIA